MRAMVYRGPYPVRVEGVGPSVQNLQRGDRVMVPFNIFCGSCFFCARGLQSNCHNVNPNATAVGGSYGYSHTTGGYDGGQAEYIRVPFADVGPSLIPEWMSDEDDSVESNLRSYLTLHPDNPITETGILSEYSRHGITSRFGHKRADVKHQWMDPLIVGTPWVIRAMVGYRLVKPVRKLRRRGLIDTVHPAGEEYQS